MMIFISWILAQDSGFRAAYCAQTGEQIQDDPISDGTRQLIGTSRATMDDVHALQAQGFDVVAATDPTLIGWPYLSQSD